MVKVAFENGSYAIAEVADTDEKKATGLMFREELDEKKGMLFVYGEGQGDVGIWMKNTNIPLDILFIDKNDVITKIEQGVPHSEDIMKSGDTEVKYVLELNEGFCDKNNIKEGNKIIVDDMDWVEDELDKVANLLELNKMVKEAKMVDYIKNIFQTKSF